MVISNLFSRNRKKQEQEDLEFTRRLDACRSDVERSLVAEGANWEDARDSASRAWWTAYKNRHKYSPSDPLNPEKSFKAWVKAIARNDYRNAYVDDSRKKKVKIVSASGEKIEFSYDVVSASDEKFEFPYHSAPSHDTSPEEAAIQDEWELLDRLPKHQRKAIELHYGGDLTYQEIAERMNVEKNQVNSWITSGMKTLQNNAKKNGKKK